MDKAMPEARYGRGQVEWALECLASKKRWAADDPTLLRTRIKRLLDADRDVVLPKQVQSKAAAFAFNAHEPAGKGGEASFTAFDTYCLWIGLRLLHLGFKQGEVAAALKLVRPALSKAYRGVLRRTPLVNDIRIGAPAPSRDEDYRAYLVLRGVDLIDLIRTGAVGRGVRSVASLAIVCDSFEELVAFQAGEVLIDQEVVVLEIGGAALALRALLGKAPTIKRGRPIMKP